MQQRLLLLVMLAPVLTALGCGPDGAACAQTDPRCPVGYVCAKERIFITDRDVCRKTEAKKLGAKCTLSEECQGYEARTAVCADMQRTCPTGKERECNLQCRPVCVAHDQCGPDQICWAGGGDITGVCQEGECGEQAVDCPNGLRCLWFKPGPSAGVCYAECDVLRQADCRATPPPVDAKCCAPQNACIHFAANPATATCLPTGTALLGELCDTEQSNGVPSCVEGLFCNDQLCTAGSACPPNGQCTQYCNRLGGAPACDRPGATCSTFANGGALAWGYCN